MARKETPKKVVLKKPVIRRSSQAASKKPIISLATLVTVVVFAAVVLLGIYMSRQPETVDDEEVMPTQEVKPLFSDSNLTLSGIEVAPAIGETVKLARDDKNVWAFELPAKAEADQGLVESAAAQVFALMVVDTLPDVKPADFGFDKPAYVITLTFGDGKTRVLEVGDASPINTGYYARLDKGVIQLVDLSGMDALTQLATTPPYVATPTPLVTPTATATP